MLGNEEGVRAPAVMRGRERGRAGAWWGIEEEESGEEGAGEAARGKAAHRPQHPSRVSRLPDSVAARGSFRRGDKPCRRATNERTHLRTYVRLIRNSHFSSRALVQSSFSVAFENAQYRLTDFFTNSVDRIDEI